MMRGRSPSTGRGRSSSSRRWPGQGRSEQRKPPLTLTYHDGYFYPPTDDMRYYFGTHPAHGFHRGERERAHRLQHLVAQNLGRSASRCGCGRRCRTKLWLIRNAPASVGFSGVSETDRDLEQPQGAAGYGTSLASAGIERADFATMAATAVRDQTGLALVPGKGSPWVRTGHGLRSSARAAPRLAPGAASVTIGDDNFNEWRAVGTGAVLGFTLPARGRILVLTRDAVLYDSRVDGNAVYAPAGSYVFFAGVAGDTFHIRTK